MLSAASFSIAIGFALSDPPLLSAHFFHYLIFLGLGIRFATIKLQWTSEVILCLIIGVSALVATAISPLVGRNIYATAFLTSITALLIPLLFVRNLKPIFYALIPLCYLQAGVMTWQWFVEGYNRAPGLAHNANAGSTLLLLGAIFLISQPRLKWFSVPLLLAIPFSGSRWVVIVGVVVLSLMFSSRFINWRFVLVGISIAFVVLFGLQQDQMRSALRIGSSPNITEATAATLITGGINTKSRMTPATPIITPRILIPQGFIDSNLHNVPLRMAVETGLLSGLAWLGVGFLVLYRRPRYGYQWWMMLAVCLLSVMYYHTWIGPMGTFWWLLTGNLMNGAFQNPRAALRRSWGRSVGFLKRAKAQFVAGPSKAQE